MKDVRPPGDDGYDRIGPFHPYLVWAAVMLLNLLMAIAILCVLTLLVDLFEDWMWPGAPELIPF